MDHMALRNRLQGELDALVSKNKDVFSVVLEISNSNCDLHWTGAAGFAYADQAKEMKVDTPIFITKLCTSAQQ